MTHAHILERLRSVGPTLAHRFQTAAPAPALTDWALAQRLAAGDCQALAALYARYATPAYSLALRLLGDQAAAEAVVVAAFCRLRQQPVPAGAPEGVATRLLHQIYTLALQEKRELSEKEVQHEQA